MKIAVENSNDMNDWVIIGGGYRGIIGAYILSEYNLPVTLIDSQNYLGGVLYSKLWNGLFLDNGCHLFDNTNDDASSIAHNILNGEVLPVDVKYRSITNETRSDGISVPDYSKLPDQMQHKVLHEIITAASEPEKQPDTLADLFQLRYGKTIASLLYEPCDKMYGLTPNLIDPDAYGSSLFKRLKATTDRSGRLLKQIPTLDERLAIRTSDPLEFYAKTSTKYPYRNFYPKTHGMRGFCDDALAYLLHNGVNVLLNKPIDNIKYENHKSTITFATGDQLTPSNILWCQDIDKLETILLGTTQLSNLIHNTPMIIFYYACRTDQINDYTYIHDFSSQSLIFRASTPGIYGNQHLDNAYTYVCIEVPSNIDSDLWVNPETYFENIWGEAVSIGLVEGSLPPYMNCTRVPVSYRVPKLGFTVKKHEVIDQIHNYASNILFSSKNVFAKDQIVHQLRILLGEHLEH